MRLNHYRLRDLCDERKEKLGKFTTRDLYEGLKEKGLTQGYETISAYRKGNIKEPSIIVLNMIAEFFGIDVFELIDNGDEYKKVFAKNILLNPTAEISHFMRSKYPITNDDCYNITVYDGAVGAGSNGDIIINSNETIKVSKRFFLDKNIDVSNLVMFKVVGDSMSPTIDENDWVMIDMANGRGFYPVDAIYLINIDGSIQIKRLQFEGTKGIKIISDNKTFSEKNSKDCDNFEILGKLYAHIDIGSGLALKN